MPASETAVVLVGLGEVGQTHRRVLERFTEVSLVAGGHRPGSPRHSRAARGSRRSALLRTAQSLRAAAYGPVEVERDGLAPGGTGRYGGGEAHRVPAFPRTSRSCRPVQGRSQGRACRHVPSSISALELAMNCQFAISGTLPEVGKVGNVANRGLGATLITAVAQAVVQ